ncbi:MAG: molybdate transport system substrate-binding protein [Sulfurimonas sp.]|jgi:molybdate transport system substrate-binding protein|uniref:molybdate ABC transporter substrate-binding protein n=1 Tax=Sulfurimonas sp. TaxID=2022749 RepID=UPI0039E6F1F7
MIKTLLLFFLLQFSVFAETINLALSANVSYAIKALTKEFNNLYPNVKIRVIVGSSGKLTAQINNGAPYDIFMSANMKYPKALFMSANAITSPSVYARGSLAYLSVKERDFSKGLDILNTKEISKIAIANPKTAPYGKASFEALKNANLLEKIKSKIVYGESAAQTLSYTVSAVDIGFVAKSSLYSPKLKRFKKGVHWEEVESSLYKPIEQGIVLLKRAKGKKSAQDFYDFILGKKAQKIFIKYGYEI